MIISLYARDLFMMKYTLELLQFSIKIHMFSHVSIGNVFLQNHSLVMTFNSQQIMIKIFGQYLNEKFLQIIS